MVSGLGAILGFFERLFRDTTNDGPRYKCSSLPHTSKIDFTDSFSKIDFLLLAKIFMSVKLVVLTFIIQYPAS